MLRKRVWMCVLVLMTLFLISACGGGGANDAAGEATEAEATETESTETEAEAGVEPLTVLASTTFGEQETGGMIWKRFIERVSELSDGAVTVNVNWGGTLFDSPGEFDAVADGAVNLVALGHMPHIDKVPYLSFPGWAPGGVSGVVDYFNTLMFDDPETSKLIQDEAAEKGIKYLNVIAGGTNAFCANYAFTDLDGLVKNSKSFGNMSAATFETLGFQVTSLFPPDIYDALNRGLIDSTQMGFAPMVSMAWYEVAPYWALDGTYTAGNMFTVNLDWWNGLSDAQRDVLQTAADDTEQYSMTIYDDAIAADIKKVEDFTGNKFVEFSDADIARIWDACFTANAEAARRIGESHGKTEGVEIILKKAAEITGADWN